MKQSRWCYIATVNCFGYVRITKEAISTLDKVECAAVRWDAYLAAHGVRSHDSIRAMYPATKLVYVAQIDGQKIVLPKKPSDKSLALAYQRTLHGPYVTCQLFRSKKSAKRWSEQVRDQIFAELEPSEHPAKIREYMRNF